MIKEKKYMESVERVKQNYDTRLDKIRLGMNEYVPAMSQKLYEKIMDGFSAELASAYPEVNPVYEALASFLRQPKERLILSNGADMAIKIVFETFCSDNDVIATCSPTFAMYKVHASLLNCKFTEVYSDDEGAFSREKLLSLGQPGTKLIIIANPSGVTGYSFSVEDIKQLLHKTKLNDTLVVLDETYADFGNIDMSSLIEEYDNLVIVRSFSKNIGMAGLRIGYILSSEYLISMMEKFRPMMEINSLAVKAVKTICSDRSFLYDAVKEIIQMRRYFAQQLSQLGYKVIERDGNFILVDFKDKRALIEESLKANNIEYRAFSNPLEKYIRFTIATTPIMKRVIEIISKV